MASTWTLNHIQRFGANLKRFVLDNIVSTVLRFSIQSSIYGTENAATDLNAAQYFVLSFLHGLFTEDVMLCTLLIQMSERVEQLKSTYLKLWLRDDYVFKKEDVAKGLKTFEKLVSQMDLEVPELLAALLWTLAEKYHFDELLPISETSVNSQNLEAETSTLDTALCRAVLDNSAAEVISAATRGGNINLKTDSGDSLYHLAASKGCVHSIAALRSLEANVEVRDAERRTAIQRGVISDNSDVVTALLEAGANFKRKGKYGNTLVHIAVMKSCNKALETLLNSGADLEVENHKGETPIALAVKNYNITAIRLLFDKGVDPNLRLKNEDSLLHLACSLNNADVVRHLISAGAKTDNMNKSGSLPIHICHDKNIIEALVSSGASVDGKSSSGNTALHLKVLEGDFDSAEFLITLGADVDSNEGKTPLMLAVEGNRADILHLLLDEGADPNTQDSLRFNVALRAAECGRLTLLQMLEADGADLWVVAENDFNILHIAALNGHSDVVSWLLSFKIDGILSARSKFKGWVCKYNFQNSPDYYAICEPFLWTALHLSSFKGDLETVRTLLAPFGPNVKDNHNITPLHVAAHRGNFSVVSELLAHNCEISAKSEKNLTACHLAANEGHFKILKLLIRKGAKVDEKGYNDWTALHFAAARGHLEMVRFLLRCGANINAKTVHNYTPLKISGLNKHEDISKELESNGGTF